MAVDAAQVRMSADDREALAMWQRQFAAIDRLDKKLNELGAAGARSGERMAGSFERALANMVTLGAGIALVKRGFDAVISEQQRIQAEEKKAATSLDEAFRKLRTQAGRDRGKPVINEENAQQVQETLADVGQRLSVRDLTDVYALAQQQLSSGMPLQTVLGGALESTLKGIVASNVLGQADPKEIAKVQAQSIKAQGLELSPESVARVNTAIQQLFQGTDVQFEDLGFLAKEQKGIATLGKQPLEEIYATFSLLRDTLKPETAAVQYRNVTAALATAGGEKSKVQALKDLGLTPEDVDMVGESWDEAMTRLRDAAAAVEENARNIAFAKLFGKENVPGALALTERRQRQDGTQFDALAEIRRRTAIAKNRAAFEEAVQINVQGSAAAERRGTLRTSLARATPEAGRAVIIESELESAAAEQYRLRSHQGATDRFAAIINNLLRSTIYNTARLGLSPERAARLAGGLPAETIARAIATARRETSELEVPELAERAEAAAPAGFFNPARVETDRLRHQVPPEVFQAILRNRVQRGVQIQTGIDEGNLPQDLRAHRGYLLRQAEEAARALLAPRQLPAAREEEPVHATPRPAPQRLVSGPFWPREEGQQPAEQARPQPLVPAAPPPSAAPLVPAAQAAPQESAQPRPVPAETDQSRAGRPAPRETAAAAAAMADREGQRVSARHPVTPPPRPAAEPQRIAGRDQRPLRLELEWPEEPLSVATDYGPRTTDRPAPLELPERQPLAAAPRFGPLELPELRGERSERPAVALADPALQRALGRIGEALGRLDQTQGQLAAAIAALPGETAAAVAAAPQVVSIDPGAGRSRLPARKSIEGFNA